MKMMQKLSWVILSLTLFFCAINSDLIVSLVAVMVVGGWLIGAMEGGVKYVRRYDWWLVVMLLIAAATSGLRGGWNQGDWIWLIGTATTYQWVVVGRVMRRQVKNIEIKLVSTLAVLALIMGLLWILNTVGIPIVSMEYWQVVKHNHLGDLFVLVMLGLWGIRNKIQNVNLLRIVMILLGVSVVVSLSRSAYLAGFFGGLYMIYDQEKVKIRSKHLFILIFVFAVSVIWAGTTKTTIWSRVYLWQSWEVMMANFWGIGMENLYNFALEKRLQIYNTTFVSGRSHNLLLEYGVGWGWVAITSFIAWLSSMLRIALRKKGLLLGGALVGIATLMMFDYIYVMPLFLILLGVLIGVSDDESL